MHQQREGTLQAALFPQRRVFAGQLILGTVLWEPLRKVPHALWQPSAWPSEWHLTYLALSEDPKWEYNKEAIHQALCTAQHTRGGGAGRVAKAPDGFGTSLEGV